MPRANILFDGLFRSVTVIFDRLEALWESPRTRQVVGKLLVFAFILALTVIELNRQNLLPRAVHRFVPDNHFYAVNIAFTLLLIVEVIGLVMVLVRSVADSVGKYFEVLSLILLRQSFEELVHFDEPIKWPENISPVLHILSDGAGALSIFVVLGYYYRIQLHRPITSDLVEARKFVTAKKLVSLLLLIAFFGIGGRNAWFYFVHGTKYSFFDTFYTILIFSDVLIVLISLRYSSTYHVVFRNSGFALATLLIRLALTAPPYISVALGFGAAVFVVGLTLSYNAFSSVQQPDTLGRAAIDEN